MMLQDKIDHLNAERRKAIAEHRLNTAIPELRLLCQEIEKSHPHYRVKWSERDETYVLVRKKEKA